MRTIQDVTSDYSKDYFSHILAVIGQSTTGKGRSLDNQRVTTHSRGPLAG